MRLLFILLSVLVSIPMVGQEVVVLEKGTGKPLSYVAIYNKDKSKSTFTALQGRADISNFSSREIIIFKHLSHFEYATTKAEISVAGGKVYLVADDTELQEVVLSVSRFKQKKQEVPQQIIRIKPSDIAFSNPQTSADLLQSTGRVFVQKSQLGGGSPMIRGFSTNRLLITVDGVRMNNAIFRSGNLQNIISIDPLAVHETEIILGPGSVVYGSDAIGGVMNFYTLKPVFSYQGERLSGNVISRYSSANSEKTVHADVNIGFEKWAFLSSVTYSDFDDLVMGSHGPEEYLRPRYVVTRNGEDMILENDNPKLQKPTGYKQVNLLQKFAYQPHEQWDFSVGMYYSTTSDYARYDRLYQEKDGRLRFAEWYYGPQTWFLGNFQIEKKGDGILYDKAKFTAAYQYFEESRNDRSLESEIRYSSREQVDAYSANLDFEKVFKKNKLFYGLEYVLNFVESEGSAKNIRTNSPLSSPSRYPDGSTWQSLAAYSGLQWELNDRLHVQLGARYNTVIIKAGFENSFYEFPFTTADLSTGSLTGSAGVNYKSRHNITWKANIATAFRAPNIDDIGKIFDSEPGSVVVPNPALKPEYAYNSEVGVEWEIADFFKLDVTSFYTILDNAMVRRDFALNGKRTLDYQGKESNIQAVQNAANAYVYGFEAGVKLKFSSNLSLLSQLTLTKGEEELENGSLAPLRHAAPVFGTTHLVWTRKKLKLDLYSMYNGQFDYDELAPTEQGKAYLYAVDEHGNPWSPSWYTLNLTGNYQVSKNWQATASIENITDQRYRTYSSGITAAGRNLILALQFSF